MVGVVCVVAGGLVAAVTASVPSGHGAWAAAYLVLVPGVAQLGLGVGQALLAVHPPPRRVVAIEFTVWNVGNMAVLVGTLLDVVLLVDAGGALLILALVLLILAVRRTGRRGGSWLHLYRLVIAVVLVSVPIGLLLARL